MKELLTMGKKTGAVKPTQHRKTKAALAAGVVASTVAATAAYRRHNARQTPNTDYGAGPQAGPGATQPL